MKKIDNKMLYEINERLNKIVGCVKQIENDNEFMSNVHTTLDRAYRVLCDVVNLDADGEPLSEIDKDILNVGKSICSLMTDIENMATND